ncbi:MAG: MerR family transcriptional regulator [Eubacteriales bacterium]
MSSGSAPSNEVSESGYRYYRDEAIERLWRILFYRELDFPLKGSEKSLSSAGFDRKRALEEHLALLQKSESVWAG